MSRRGVDLCCLQATKWQKDGVSQIVEKDSHIKMFLSGNDNGTGEVGILLAEEWWERVFEEVRVFDRIILIRMTIGKTVFVFVSLYAPQADLSEQKGPFLPDAAMHSSHNPRFRTAHRLW